LYFLATAPQEKSKSKSICIIFQFILNEFTPKIILRGNNYEDF